MRISHKWGRNFQIYYKREIIWPHLLCFLFYVVLLKQKTIKWQKHWKKDLTF